MQLTTCFFGYTVTYRFICLAMLSLLFILVQPNNASCQEPIIIGPDYEPDSLLTDLNNPKGTRFEFEMPLSVSKIFKGDDPILDPDQIVHENRKIYVYVPAAYKNGTNAPVMITLDGPIHFNQVSHALDNLTIQKNTQNRLPAFVLIAVQNGGGLGKGSQRGLEYDTMSDRFARFINEEVLPAVGNNEEIRKIYPDFGISVDPWERAVMGCSSGGAAAFTMGWFRPDLFRRIISYSGTFVDQQTDEIPEELMYPLGAWEYHSGINLIKNSEKKPLRIFIHVSEYDLMSDAKEETHLNWVMANERMAVALDSKDYTYRYLFSLESKHCDSKVFGSTLAQTLLWIWSDIPSR